MIESSSLRKKCGNFEFKCEHWFMCMRNIQEMQSFWGNSLQDLKHANACKKGKDLFSRSKDSITSPFNSTHKNSTLWNDLWSNTYSFYVVYWMAFFNASNVFNADNAKNKAQMARFICCCEWKKEELWVEKKEEHQGKWKLKLCVFGALFLAPH